MKFIVDNDTTPGKVENGLWTSKAHNTAFKITFYKTFTIGLNMIN